MKKQEQDLVIDEIQKDIKKIVVSNPLAILKFNKQEGKNFVQVSTQEIGVFIPKIVWEVVSLLSNDDLNRVETETIKKRIYIKDFLKSIGVDEKNYKYVTVAARLLRFWEISSINDKNQEVYRGFFNDVTHDKKSGYIDLQIATDWAKALLEIAKSGNVSFLKQNIFDLQNSHAINLYPTLKANLYKGKFEITVDEFRSKFGYATIGYNKYSNLKARVIKSAIDEINDKGTDISVYLKEDGSNLEGLRSRVKSLTFYIKTKDEPVKILQTETQPQTPNPETPSIHAIPKPISQKVEEKQATEDAPTLEMITILGERAKFTSDQIEYIIDYFEDELITVWERLTGFLQLKSQNRPIERPLPYLLKAEGLGIGLWKKHLAASKTKGETKRVTDDKSTLENIQAQYRKQSRTHFEQLYNELPPKQKEHQLQMLWEKEPNKKIYFSNNSISQPNHIGIEVIGQHLAFPNGYDHNRQLKVYALKHFNLAIDLKKDGNWVIL